MDETKQPGLRVGQIFLGSVHFEHRKDALSLPANTNVGELNIRVNIRAGSTEDETKGLVAVIVETTDEDPLYRFSFEMIALMEQDESKNLGMREFVTKFGSATLYPFLREAVANVTGRGRFGPIWLKPFNVGAVQLETDEVVPPQDGRTQPRQEDAPGPP